LSWIVRDLWRSLEARRAEYEPLLKDQELQAFETINEIASQVGARWGVFLQVNFPPGRKMKDALSVGHRDLSILVYREKRKFERVTVEELKEAFGMLKPLSFDSTGFGYEGLRVRLSVGRIDCLPGGVHLWCDLTAEVLAFLDWLFANAYGLRPTREAGPN
jgi:hypothetical protein